MLERKITVGNLLTVLSVLVSVSALYYSWVRDRELREREQANVVREAAARTLAKLERREAVTVYLFHDLQPAFVEASEFLDEDFDVAATRDLVWKQANNSRNRVLSMQLDENLEAVYVDLFSYRTDLRPVIQAIIAALDAQEERTFLEFISELETTTFDFHGRRADYQTADLGNALRQVASRYRSCLEREHVERLEPLKTFLARLVGMRDEQILDAQSGAPGNSASLDSELDRLGKPRTTEEWICR